jgi:hypothetical protein
MALSNRAIADVMGVERETINRDVRGANAPQEEAAPEEGENENGANAPHNNEPQKRQFQKQGLALGYSANHRPISPRVRSMPGPAATTWLCCLMGF